MKGNQFFRFVALVGAFVLGACGSPATSRHAISLNELPDSARRFLETYYAGAAVADVESAPGDTLARYVVSLEDQTRLQFDGAGRCTAVLNYLSGVPQVLVPTGIADHAETIFPGTLIVGYRPGTSGSVVTLDNGIRLFYDSQGKFIRYDQFRQD